MRPSSFHCWLTSLQTLLVLSGGQASFISYLLPVDMFFKPGLEKGCDKRIDQEMDDVVRDNGFTLDRHEVTTKDGYVLPLHRLVDPKRSSVTGQDKGPVILVHALVTPSIGYLWNKRDQSLAYVLSDAGYDVWLLDTRGSAYSLKHTRLSCTKPDYWNFSYHEGGHTDLAKAVDYVLEQTKATSLSTFGMSMGGAQIMVLLSTRPEYNKKVRVAILLSPSVNVTGTSVYFFKPVLDRYRRRGNENGVFMKNYNFVNDFALASQKISLLRPLATMITEYFFGKENPLYFDKSKIGTYLYYAPRLSSAKTFDHFFQCDKARQFQMYDGGPQKNLIMYNQTSPPLYPVEKVSTPVALYGAENDLGVLPENLAFFKKLIPNLIHYRILPKASHLDYIFTVNAEASMFPEMISILNRYHN